MGKFDIFEKYYRRLKNLPAVGLGLPLLVNSTPARTLILLCALSLSLSYPPCGSSVIISG